MFGLMRAQKCGMSADEKHFRRLNYCGTCKTIGSLYSAKSRLLLNHDTVFLAEILSSLSRENTAEWQRSYQSFNCLSLPKDSIPASLAWAAAANVVLTEFKIADHGRRPGGRAPHTVTCPNSSARGLLGAWKTRTRNNLIAAEIAPRIDRILFLRNFPFVRMMLLPDCAPLSGAQDGTRGVDPPFEPNDRGRRRPVPLQLG